MRSGALRPLNAYHLPKDGYGVDLDPALPYHGRLPNMIDTIRPLACRSDHMRQ